VMMEKPNRREMKPTTVKYLLSQNLFRRHMCWRASYWRVYPRRL